MEFEVLSVTPTRSIDGFPFSSDRGELSLKFSVFAMETSMNDGECLMPRVVGCSLWIWDKGREPPWRSGREECFIGNDMNYCCIWCRYLRNGLLIKCRNDGTLIQKRKARLSRVNDVTISVIKSFQISFFSATQHQIQKSSRSNQFPHSQKTGFLVSVRNDHGGNTRILHTELGYRSNQETLWIQWEIEEHKMKHNLPLNKSESSAPENEHIGLLLLRLLGWVSARDLQQSVSFTNSQIVSLGSPTLTREVRVYCWKSLETSPRYFLCISLTCVHWTK